jgi:hypothetical protein
MAAGPQRSQEGGSSPLRLLLQSLPNPVVLRSACDDPLLQPRQGTRAGLPAMVAAVQPSDVRLLVSRPLAPRNVLWFQVIGYHGVTLA